MLTGTMRKWILLIAAMAGGFLAGCSPMVVTGAPDVDKTAFGLGFNRSMQHLKFCVSRRSVANEAKNEDLLLG